jgi:uncharacterized membrane protein YhdT
MLLRGLVMFLVSGAMLFGWALWQESGARKTPLWQGLAVVLATLMFMVSTVVLVTLSYRYIIAPFLSPNGSPWSKLIFLPGVLLGAWSASLGIQILSNAARRVLSKPARKLELFRKPARKKREKAAAAPPAEH